MKATTHQILKKHWGYDKFRPMQEDIINSVLGGKDTLAILSTGGGKSITFQVPGMMMDGMVIVVCPLIALMQDQVDSLNAAGITATCIHSNIDKRKINARLVDAKNGHYKFLYLSPERLDNDNLLRFVNMMNVCLIVIDEAHCISQWGYDFRPAYHHIKSFRKWFAGVPIIALTATANEHVQADIVKSLEFREGHNLFLSTFKRTNLCIEVRKTEEKFKEIIHYIAANEGKCGIIFCRIRKKAEAMAAELKKRGVSATFYHGGMSSIDRENHQNLWIKGYVDVMCCTHAFGMGIDKSDVRFVFHVDIPEGLEAYFQEIGRAGRDGDESDCKLLYSGKELQIQ